jgi:hypothetical protein
MCPRPRFLSALALTAAIAVTGLVPPAWAAAPKAPRVQSAKLVRFGGFAYYSRTLATVGPGDTAARRALSALLPRSLPPPPSAVLCADCRMTRLELAVSGRRRTYVWDAAPPRSLRPLVAALRRHG